VPAVLRVIHPAPALAVVLHSGALAAILAAQAGGPIDAGPVLLTVLSIAGSQVFTGATNDLADRERDAAVRPEKPIPSGDLSVNAALWVASIGLGVQLAASLRLGVVPLALGVIATASALAYNLALSRTPTSVIPYLVSFGVLPFWIAAGIDVPLARVVPAAILVAPVAAAAHLANAARDWEADALGGSRSLAQVLGRERSRHVALGLAFLVGMAVGVALLADGRASPAVIGLGLIGFAAIGQGATSSRRLWYGMLVAAVAWTAAWGIASG
jgi:4-hydroxybenzoate polyprenyltransferase